MRRGGQGGCWGGSWRGGGDLELRRGCRCASLPATAVQPCGPSAWHALMLVGSAGHTNDDVDLGSGDEVPLHSEDPHPCPPPGGEGAGARFARRASASRGTRRGGCVVWRSGVGGFGTSEGPWGGPRTRRPGGRNPVSGWGPVGGGDGGCPSSKRPVLVMCRGIKCSLCFRPPSVNSSWHAFILEGSICSWSFGARRWPLC